MLKSGYVVASFAVIAILAGTISPAQARYALGDGCTSSGTWKKTGTNPYTGKDIGTCSGSCSNGSSGFRCPEPESTSWTDVTQDNCSTKIKDWAENCSFNGVTTTTTSSSY